MHLPAIPQSVSLSHPLPRNSAAVVGSGADVALALERDDDADDDELETVVDVLPPAPESSEPHPM
jgi:hypothetical protein